MPWFTWAAAPISGRRPRPRRKRSRPPSGPGELYRDYPLAELEAVETRWAQAREALAAVGSAQGLASLEHAHWDWRDKAESVEIGRHMLLAIECNGEVQGLMAVLRNPRPA